jgi:putative membrane protein
MIAQSPDPIDPLVGPAADRGGMAEFNTKLALDRTMLAWIRTALTMASFGFGMVAFFRSRVIEAPNSKSRYLHEGAILVGVAMLVLGIAAVGLAGLSHWRSLERLRRGEPLALIRWPLSLVVGVLFAVIGLAGLWALFAR